jgi:hypothetical protein
MIYIYYLLYLIGLISLIHPIAYTMVALRESYNNKDALSFIVQLIIITSIITVYITAVKTWMGGLNAFY